MATTPRTNTGRTVVTDRTVAGPQPDDATPTGSIGGNVPVGGIIMYAGAFADIPSNWHLCNGEDGTPDLTDRFILATNTEGDIGTYGGTAQHLHEEGTLVNSEETGGTPEGSITSASAGTPSGTVTVNKTTANDTNVTGAGARLTDASATFAGSLMSGHVHTFVGVALSDHTHEIDGETSEGIAALAIAWVSGADYVVGDRSSFDGANYVCIADIEGGTDDPATDTDHWAPEDMSDVRPPWYKLAFIQRMS